jgi:pantoate--beta-alanine ligase
MQTVKRVKEVREIVKAWKTQGFSIGFVPTMGYLHEGHESLIEKAKSGNDKIVVSIFVNPIQFGPNEDLASYPRDLERDKKICEKAGADLIFAPADSEMYLKDASTYVNVEELTEFLDGAARPGHFQKLQEHLSVRRRKKSCFGIEQKLKLCKRSIERL